MVLTMKKNGTFIANNTMNGIINVQRGKMQWNTGTPEFRTAMSHRYDALVQLSFLQKQANEDIKTLEKHIEFTKNQAMWSSTDVEKDEADIQKIQEAVASAKAEYKENTPVITEADENLYYAYKTYINGEEKVGSADTYVRAFYEWSASNGLNPTEETFKFIIKAMGKRKLSANAIAKNNGEKLTGELSPTAFFDLFYREIMQCMKAQNLLRSYKFTNEYANELVKKAMAKVQASK